MVHRRLIIFDLDGTLVDSLEDIACALDLALDDHQIKRPSRNTVRSWIGGGMRNLIAQAVEPSQIDAVLARFRTHYAASPVVHTKLYDGLDVVLDQLPHKLAVLSNKAHALTTRIAEVLLSRWQFAPVIGQRDHVKLKPAPDAALEIAREVGIAPADCILVGDSEIDIATAHAAGMTAVGVSWGFRPRAELAAASWIADAPGDLVRLK